jgi:hypothetical protein
VGNGQGEGNAERTLRKCWLEINILFLGDSPNKILPGKNYNAHSPIFLADK